METLIFNGSPHKNGDTSSLIKQLTGSISGKCTIINAYNNGISPCIDCRFCVKNKGCSINDDMQAVYELIQNCDNIIIASPIHFDELTGRLLCVAGRLQTYYCAKAFRKEEPIKKPKKGGIILVGGASGSAVKAESSARIMLHHMNCYDIYNAVISRGTDISPAINDKEAVKQLEGLAAFLNNSKETIK